MAMSLVQANTRLQTEVTQRRHAEQRLQQVLAASPLGMFVCDERGACQFTNAAWQQLFGLDAERSHGLGWQRLVHPADAQRLQEEWQSAITHQAPFSIDYRLCHADGNIAWLRSHASPLDGSSFANGLVGIVDDISAPRLLQRELAERGAALARSNEDLERFAYLASHDLQEPLRMVTSYGQLLVRRHQAELKPEAREFMQYMVDGGQRAQALIRDLLSVARVDSQAQAKQAVALQAVLEAALHELRGPLQDSGAVVSHDELPTVLADQRQLGQLMTNLVHNALKFRGAAPATVHVSARHEVQGDGACWRISVRDNGIGIEARFFERVFVMFQRLHLRTEHEGTGIGLAICKKIVERHGGQIGVISEKGQGSEFFFTLPDLLAQGAAAPSPALSPALSPAPAPTQHAA
jgi:PAS domain S-box-containing protein